MINCSAISCREQVKFWWDHDNDDVRFVLDQHNELDFYSASSFKQQSAGSRVAPLTRTHYSASEPTILCSYSLKLHA